MSELMKWPKLLKLMTTYDPWLMRLAIMEAYFQGWGYFDDEHCFHFCFKENTRADNKGDDDE